MNKANKRVIALSVAAAIALPGMAQAFTISGVTFTPGSTLVIGTIYEGRVDGLTPYGEAITAAGQELGGVGIVDAIKDANGNTVWSNGDNSTELTFQFGGFMSETPVFFGGPGVAPIGINFSGGWANFYAGTGGDQDFITSPIASMLTSATNGTEWLNLVGGSTGTFCAGAGVDCTLQSFITAGTLGAIGSGAGNGFLDVSAGLGVANTNFDTNGVVGGHDLILGSSFNSNNATGAMFASGSMDLRGTPIPEPSTLALLGLGLIGFSMNARRKLK